MPKPKRTRSARKPQARKAAPKRSSPTAARKSPKRTPSSAKPARRGTSPKRATAKGGTSPRRLTREQATRSLAKRFAVPKISPLSGETVDSYVRNLPSPQQTIVNRLRSLVAAAAPEALESVRWSQPVFEAEGPFAHVKAHGGAVDFGFWRGGLLEAPPGVLEGDANEMMRHVTLTSLRDFKDGKEDVLKGLVRQAVLLNQRLGDPTRR